MMAYCINNKANYILRINYTELSKTTAQQAVGKVIMEKEIEFKIKYLNQLYSKGARSYLWKFEESPFYPFPSGFLFHLSVATALLKCMYDSSIRICDLILENRPY